MRLRVRLVIWLTIAAMFATQFTLADRAVGGPPGLPWWSYFGNELLGWGSFILALPLIVAMLERFPLFGVSRQAALGHLVVHALVATCIHLLIATVGSVLLIKLGVVHVGMTLSQFVLMRSVGGFAAAWMVYATALMLHSAISYHDAYRARETRAAQLEAQLTGAQLDVLRMQLHPHFLFNTLHGISGLMVRDVPAARRMMSRLSDLLRLSLDDATEQEVSLADEMDFLGRYVEIQLMRFGDRLTVTIDVEAEAAGQSVPRLLLQPLVENAIRHGTSRLARPGVVALRAYVAEERLRIEIRDNGAGLGREPPVEGIGLRNTRERLRQLYGSHQRFEIASHPDGGTLVRIELPASSSVREALEAGRHERDVRAVPA